MSELQLMPKKPQWLLLMLILIPIYACASIDTNSRDWRQLKSGLAYQQVTTHYLTPWSCIHAFKIQLSNNKLMLASAHDLTSNTALAKYYQHNTQALLAINGGFFDEKFQPLGLRISNYQQQHGLRAISWWGVFYIKNNKPAVITTQQFKSLNLKKIDFAIQAGPRLIIQGNVPKLKSGRAERSALGITAQGEVIIVVTDNEPLSMTALAQMMRLPPFNCVEALNLDGGSSSQLYAHINSFKLNVFSFAEVSDAIIVKS